MNILLKLLYLLRFRFYDFDQTTVPAHAVDDARRCCRKIHCSFNGLAAPSPNESCAPISEQVSSNGVGPFTQSLWSGASFEAAAAWSFSRCAPRPSRSEAVALNDE